MKLSENFFVTESTPVRNGVLNFLRDSRAAVAAAAFAAISGCTDDPYEAPIDRSNSDDQGQTADGGFMEDAQTDEDGGVKLSDDAGMTDSKEIERDVANDVANDVAIDGADAGEEAGTDSGMDVDIDAGESGKVVFAMAGGLNGPNNFSYPGGTNDALIASFMVANYTGEPVTLNFVSLQGCIDGDATTDNWHCNGIDAREDGITLISDILEDTYLRSGHDGPQISTVETLGISGNVNFDGLNIVVQPSLSRVIFSQAGDINGSPAYGVVADRIKFGIMSANDVVLTYEDGQQVPPEQIEIGNADNYGEGSDDRWEMYQTIVHNGTIECTESSTPTPINVPKGALAVNFACFDCSASGWDVDLYAIHSHHFGAGSENDFDATYLYEGDQRLTDKTDIDPHLKLAYFTDLNLTISEGTTRTFCVHADVSPDAVTGAQHGFEILDFGNIYSNAAVVKGDYPVSGPLMTIVD